LLISNWLTQNVPRKFCIKYILKWRLFQSILIQSFNVYLHFLQTKVQDSRYHKRNHHWIEDGSWLKFKVSIWILSDPTKSLYRWVSLEYTESEIVHCLYYIHMNHIENIIKYPRYSVTLWLVKHLQHKCIRGHVHACTFHCFKIVYKSNIKWLLVSIMYILWYITLWKW
jgi:hypothetical protein